MIPTARWASRRASRKKAESIEHSEKENKAGKK
jgi:hypothetical protein